MILLSHLVWLVVALGYGGIIWSTFLIIITTTDKQYARKQYPREVIFVNGQIVQECLRLLTFLCLGTIGVGFLLYPTPSMSMPIELGTIQSKLLVTGVLGAEIVQWTKALHAIRWHHQMQNA